MANPDVMEVLTRVETFYNNAFTHLVLFTFGLLALAGVVIPLVIQFYQNRAFRGAAAELKSDLRAYADELRNKLRDELEGHGKLDRQELEKQIEAIRKESMENYHQFRASTHHLQGNTRIQNDETILAIGDYIVATESYLECDNQLGLGRVISLLIEAVDSITWEDIEEGSHFVNIDERLGDALKSLEKENTSGRYSDDMSKMKAALSQAKKRHRQGSTKE